MTDDLYTCEICSRQVSIDPARYPDLLTRAVGNARCDEYRKGVKHARWVAVMDAFGCGKTLAHDLCVEFGFDPDEMVER